MNDAARFRRLEALFHALARADAGERAARLDALRGEDRSLAAELDALLAAHDAADTDRPMREALAVAAGDMLHDAVAGRLFGPWRVLRAIGAGGMGTVYLAERADGAYEARAALKVVSSGALGPALQERLREERQILASLSHPGIARLLDGGSAEDGTPFLVMEYVEGVPLTTWCDAHAPALADRIRLVLAVCDAVSHAHRQLVVHRDLKPGNILVTARGEPKLLDFGIATLVDAVERDHAGGGPENAPASVAARTLGSRHMTPGYASPEQVRGERVGVAADVYALGVILYELATGRLPVAIDGLTPEEMIREIITREPPPPSAVADGRRLRRRLAGDVDAIVSRALAKDPGERYPSVEALADDLRRHLVRRPVSVRESAWAYRSRKFLHRNAGSVVTGLLAVIVLIAFTVSTYLQAEALARERDLAEARRATAERTTAFLGELFTAADPNEHPTLDVTAREMLDRGAERLVADLAGEPAVQAALATVIGRVYRALGEYETAAPLLALAVEGRRVPGADRHALAESLTELGALAYDRGAYEQALALHAEALETLLGGRRKDPALEARLVDWRSASLNALGRIDEAEAAARRHLALVRDLHDPPHGELAVAHLSLADTLRAGGAHEASLEHAEEALRQRRALYAPPHLDIAHSLNHVASSLHALGRAAEALPLVEEGLAMRRAIFPEGHVEVAASLGNRARMLASLGRFEEAADARRESLTMLRSILGEVHPYVAGSAYQLGSLLLAQNELPEARVELEASARSLRALDPTGHPRLSRTLTALGGVYLRQGAPGEAETVLREAYELERSRSGADRWEIAESGLELGRALDRLGRVAEAEALFVESHELLVGAFGVGDERSRKAIATLAAHYRARGLDAQADALGGAPAESAQDD